MKKNAVQAVMNELCLYGGLLATRAEVYADLEAKAAGRLSFLAIERFVFMCQKATKDDVARCRRHGLTLAAFQ